MLAHAFEGNRQKMRKIPEHGSWPEAHEEECEQDGGDIGGDLGGAELADDNLQRRAVMEVFAVIKIQFTLVHLKLNEIIAKTVN